MDKCDSLDTPMATKPKLDEDLSELPVDQTKYRSMIGSLMYLTSNRSDLVQAGTINMGLWYPKDIGFELTAFLDADHAGCLDTRKSTSGEIQSRVRGIIHKLCSSNVDETQLKDYGFNYNKISLYCDTQSALTISCNLVHYSCTKHINVCYHFIKEQVEHGVIELYSDRNEYQLADMFTKALPQDRFEYLVRRIGMRCLTVAEMKVLANESA
nr:hypothetical protein [Tanacetum cinerariifolium]